MRRVLSILLALGLVLGFSLVTAVPALAAPEVWVDASNACPGTGTELDPYCTIQLGIANVDTGGTVHVAAGTYNEDIILVNGVKVLGAGANVTTITGTGSGEVVRADGLTSPATRFDGFTIEDGSAGFGGGIYINGSSLTVSNCVFFNNEAPDNDGGGMFINNASPTVTGCTFDTNRAGTHGGGIACMGSSSPIIANNIIIYNGVTSSALGIGGGGIACLDSSSPTIINNTIVNNTVVSDALCGGGGIYTDSSSHPTITNNIIFGNSAPQGGGIYAGGASPVFDYNDLVSNLPDNYYGCSGGTNAISVDPEFVVSDPKYHLNHLAPSPCIDVGNNAAVPSWLTTDFEGDPRIWQDAEFPTVDMGADEYSGNVPPLAPDITSSGYQDGGWTDDNTPEFSFIQDDPNYWDTVKYTLQIYDDPLFGSPVVDYTSELLAQGGASFTVGQAAGSGDYNEGFPGQVLDDGDYYWRVMSTDRFDAEGPWSTAGNPSLEEPAFRLDTSPPAPRRGVGGTVYPVDKTAILLPWLGLSLLLILAAGGLILARRRVR
jgi:parallel beta-helix repeat protein